MEFSKVQNKFINGKLSGYQLLKGKKGAGKSTASIYRAINLENNYCIYNEDNILVLTSHYKNTKKALEIYEGGKNKDFFYSLFSLEGDRVKIKTLEEIIRSYANGYKNSRGLQGLKQIQRENHIKMIENISEFIKGYGEKSKLISSISNEFLLEEILWIKSCAFSKEEYLEVKRPGRGKSIRKNSLSREYIYELMELYNSELIYNGYMDSYDDVLFALKYAKDSKEKYTHILIDDCESLTRGELEFVKKIFGNKSHSSMIFIVNNEVVDRENTWIRKGRSYKELGGDFKGRTFNFKTIYETSKEDAPKIMDYFKFINFKNKKELDFSVDYTSSNKEIFQGEESVNSKELINIPVYSDIAAGVPIEMNDRVECNFSLPKEWVGKSKDLFILNVKGDSMIDKNILDGDKIVIKRQNTAYHNDIVAASLDGEATLKILKTNGDEPFLMPANPKYKPIPLNNKDVSIMGVAVGIIKLGNK
ncbi:MAG: transcriptional repressor LexA [Clostridium sp.]